MVKDLSPFALAALLVWPSVILPQAPPPVSQIAYLDEVEAQPRTGHFVYPLLGRSHGTTNGFNSMVGVYTSTDYVITGTHTDQEMFFVVEGTGTALVGDQEFPIRPGATWIVRPGQAHGIKRDPGSPHVKAFFVHGAP